jgi:hypothetical protein
MYRTSNLRGDSGRLSHLPQVLLGHEALERTEALCQLPQAAPAVELGFCSYHSLPGRFHASILGTFVLAHSRELAGDA